MASAAGLELIVIAFEDGHFRGEIAKEIEKAVNTGAVSVVDLMFVAKDADGNRNVVEVSESDDPELAKFSNLAHSLTDMETSDDVWEAADDLEPGMAALIAVFENTWARGIREAVVNAGGQIVRRERIAPDA